MPGRYGFRGGDGDDGFAFRPVFGGGEMDVRSFLYFFNQDLGRGALGRGERAGASDHYGLTKIYRSGGTL